MVNHFKVILLVAILLWLFGFLYMTGGYYNTNEDNGGGRWINRLKNAEEKLAKLQLINEQNEEIIKNFQQKLNVPVRNAEVVNAVAMQASGDQSSNIGVDAKYEDTRRQIYSDIKELSFYVNDQLRQFTDKLKSDTEKTAQLKQVTSDFNDRIHVLLAEFYNLSISTNIGNWRANKAKALTAQVQDRIHRMQNPSDCSAAKKLVCDLNKACGFGCQMHHLMYCFIEAYFQDRTLILESGGWRYDSSGYESVFQPISDTCKKADEHATSWEDNADPSGMKVIHLSIIDARVNRPDYLPLGVPADLAASISEFHGNPFVWWAGQVLSYLMRFNKKFESVVQSATKRLGFKAPCVGRTDKVGTEASFHDLAEYMTHVEDYFKVQELMHPELKGQRNVYLASDELGVLNEANEKFKGYNFIFDTENAQSAALQQRYSPASLQAVILDIYFLSQCDYLVCTFSSQVCRMAYELMQMRYPDASWRYKSLDDIYYFGGQNYHVMTAIYDHTALNKDEIELKAGDEVSIAGNHWNGYSKGRNLRTNALGLFPSYKVKDKVKPAKQRSG